MTDIKDVIHFYLGAEVSVNDGKVRPSNIAELTTVSNLNLEKPYGVLFPVMSIQERLSIEQLTLRLRPLSSLTDDELQEIGYNNFHDVKAFTLEDWALTYYSPAQFLYLLKNSFDIFGLIPDQAIDKTKTEK